MPSAIWRTLRDSGLVGPDPDRDQTGDLDIASHLIAAENLAHGDPGIAIAGLWAGAAALLLSEHGTEHQESVLDALLTAEDPCGSIALFEGYGRGPDELVTTITTALDASVHVRGRKAGVPFADTATSFIVIGTNIHGGTLRAVVVDADTAGVTVESTSRTLALNAARIATVRFNVTVSASHLMGRTDADRLACTIQRMRLVNAAVQIGAAQRAIDYASAYAVDRIAFQRPISSFQGVSFPLAEAHIRVAELRLEIDEAGPGLIHDPAPIGSLAVSSLVNYAGGVAAEATGTAVQTLGGHGFITDHPVELWHRSAAALAALDFDLNHSAFQAAL